MSESINAETRDLRHRWFGFQRANDDYAKVMIRFARVFKQYVKDATGNIKKTEMLSQLRFLKAEKHCSRKTLYVI